MSRDVLEAVIRAQMTGVHRDPTTTQMNTAVTRILAAADDYAGYRPDPAAITQRRREVLEAALRKPGRQTA